MVRWNGLCTTVFSSVSLNVVVRGLAVDTETGQVYFTHSNKVEVVNPNNTGRATVVKNARSVRTYGVGVDPTER